MAADSLDPPLGAAEFCVLERQLVAGMAMRKKRNVKMDQAQQLKLELLSQIEAADPDPAMFTAALSEAVLTITKGPGTGPAQAVASDLQMDWELACSSPGFVQWLRHAAASAVTNSSKNSSKKDSPSSL